MMGETELIGIIRDVDSQYAVLFGQVITINFAMIVAIYYFLHRATLLFRAAAFGFYAIGMFSLIGLMLEQANFKSQALIALAKGPHSQFAASILAIHQSQIFRGTALFLNTSLWVLFVVIAYLLFRWRGDPHSHGRKEG
jgi:hypothetical protein